ncbi:MAG: enhanced serine sensitivity protein SseB [Ruminococcaceae bacterium]|nr:enhanced serine sensitivity protein SseB [Oscillospiraceae bacterium]
MPENEAIKELNNSILKTEIEAFKADKSRDGLLSLMHCLKCSAVFVPGKVEATDDPENNGRKKLRLTPSVLREKNGEAFMPVLTSRNEAPVIGGRKISGLALPFDSVCKITKGHGECNKIIVNPFTDRLTVSENMIDNLLKMGRKEPSLREVMLKAGEKVSFSSPKEEDTTLEKRACAAFPKFPQIEKAYLTRMTSKGETCYMFILDTKDEDIKAALPLLAKELSDPSLKFGISLSSVKAFAPFMNNCNIKFIYEK